MVLSYSADCSLRLWHVGTGRSCLTIADAHRSSITSCVVAADGTGGDAITVVSGDAEGNLYTHDLLTGSAAGRMCVVL